MKFFSRSVSVYTITINCHCHRHITAQSEQNPSSMRTSRLHVSEMSWKLPLLWERKNPLWYSLAAADDDWCSHRDIMTCIWRVFAVTSVSILHFLLKQTVYFLTVIAKRTHTHTHTHTHIYIYKYIKKNRLRILFFRVISDKYSNKTKQWNGRVTKKRWTDIIE